MIPQNVPDLIAENERLKAKLAGAMEFFKAYEMNHPDDLEREMADKDLMRILGLHCIRATQDLCTDAEADAKRWETLCSMMRNTPFGFDFNLPSCIQVEGDEMTPEALKAWLDKEAE